jgi:hypothetical protein
MAGSPAPKDSLALGRHLVHELGINRSNDTLGRWLAHELAGLIHEAEHASTTRERAGARREAARIATQLWAHRAALPGNAYPLAPYRDLLRAISLFTEDGRRPWWGYLRNTVSPHHARAAAIFRIVGHLMPVLLFLEGAPSEAPPGASLAIESLDDEEQTLVAALNAWYDALTPASPINASRGMESTAGDSPGDAPGAGGATQRETSIDDGGDENREAGLDRARLRAIAQDMIDELTQQLAALRTALEPTVGDPAGGDEAEPDMWANLRSLHTDEPRSR